MRKFLYCDCNILFLYNKIRCFEDLARLSQHFNVMVNNLETWYLQYSAHVWRPCCTMLQDAEWGIREVNCNVSRYPSLLLQQVVGGAVAKGSGRGTPGLAVRIRALLLFLGKALALYTHNPYFHPFGLKRLYYVKGYVKILSAFGRSLTNLYIQ